MDTSKKTDDLKRRLDLYDMGFDFVDEYLKQYKDAEKPLKKHRPQRPIQPLTQPLPLTQPQPLTQHVPQPLPQPLPRSLIQPLPQPLPLTPKQLKKYIELETPERKSVKASKKYIPIHLQFWGKRIY
jgi:hypothetical protein